MILNKDGSVSFRNSYTFFINVNGRANNGAEINILDNNVKKSTKYHLEYIGNGLFTIYSALNQNFCIDVNGASSNNGTKIQLYWKNSTSAQKFRFVE